MGNINSIPVLSQTKSLMQVILGDEKGARLTQEDFLYRNTFPVLSQICSAGHAIAGNPDKAFQVQQDYAKSMARFVDALPVVGHVKGGIHYAIGDKEGGDTAIKSATRSIGVISGGAAGFFVGGPVGAVTGGVIGGVVMDASITGVEKAINPKATPTGYISDVTKIVDAVEGTRSYTVDDGIHAVIRPVLDGTLGKQGIPGLAPTLKEVYFHKDEVKDDENKKQ